MSNLDNNPTKPAKTDPQLTRPSLHTHLDQVLRTQGIETLLFAGVNIDQGVTSTVEEAYLRDYGAVLPEDASVSVAPSRIQPLQSP